jgi:hypothetical protein
MKYRGLCTRNGPIWKSMMHYSARLHKLCITCNFCASFKNFRLKFFCWPVIAPRPPAPTPLACFWNSSIKTSSFWNASFLQIQTTEQQPLLIYTSLAATMIRWFEGWVNQGLEESNLFCACHLLNCDEGQGQWYHRLLVHSKWCKTHLGNYTQQTIWELSRPMPPATRAKHWTSLFWN